MMEFLKLVALAAAFIPMSTGSTQIKVFNKSHDGIHVDIRDFGGKGDGLTSNTMAFNKAIEAVRRHGGGVLTVSASSSSSSGDVAMQSPSDVNTFLTGPFNLTSNMWLVIEKGATLLGSTNLTEWPLMPPMPSYGQGRDHPGPRRVSLIHGFNLTNVTVTGEGTVDGQGPFWWQRHRTPGVEIYTRGHLIEFMYCTQLEVSHLTLTNSPFWTVHPVYSDGFHGHHLRIINDLHSPNTDGIDPDSTVNVVLHDNYIATGDDCYALKSGWDTAGIKFGAPTRNITIYNGYCQSPTSAGICIGSEMSGGVEDVSVWNMTFENTGFAFRLKTGIGRGGCIRNVSLANSTLLNCSTAFEFSAFYGGHPQSGYNKSAIPIVDGVHVNNIVGVATSVAELKGLPQKSTSSPYFMKNIYFSNVSVTGGAWVCSNVLGIAVDTVNACTCLDGASGCTRLGNL
eukprot:m.164822 g.164822  ORF g.164822 m.164822 type:complete len:453 (-) comp31356_c0_seq3:296-1654(-)